MNIVCSICSELFIPGVDIYFTQCGHVFHYHCIISWFERSRSCPECRNKINEKSIHKVFFQISNEADIDPTTLMFKLENANFTLTLRDKEIKNLKEAKHTLKDQTRLLREEVKKLENDDRTKEYTMNAFKEQIQYFKTKSKESDRLSEEIVKLKNKIRNMENLEVVLNGSRQQVNDILRDEHCTESLALLAATLKKALVDSESKARENNCLLQKTRNELSKKKKEAVLWENQTADLRRELKQIKVKNEKEKIILKQRLMATKSANKNNIVLTNSDTKLSHAIEKSHNEQDASHTSVSDTTLTVKERVETITNSDSPYLPVKTNFASFLDTKFHAPANGSSNKLSSSSSNIGYTIFKTNQNSLTDVNKGTKTSEVAYNGLGGSNKEDVFPSPKIKQAGMKRTKSTSTVTTNKFRKLAPLPNTAKVTEYFKSSQ